MRKAVVKELRLAAPFVSKDLIMALEELLEKAKAGEVSYYALLYGTTNQSVTTAFEGEDALKVLGAIRYLENQVINCDND